MQKTTRRTWPDEMINEDQWRVYSEVMKRARDKGVEFVLGGGLAISTYTGHWRNTKDMDLYTLPTTREALIQATVDVGLRDMYEQHPYDRRWIYRAADLSRGLRRYHCRHYLGDGQSALAGGPRLDSRWRRILHPRRVRRSDAAGGTGLE
jgi:hypothetical protein